MRSSKSKPKNLRHLHIIKLLGDAKKAALYEFNDDDLPSLSLCPLLRQRAMASYPPDSPIAVYMIKQSGELIVDEGQYVDPLKENPKNMIHLGKNPEPCMPMRRREAFQSELKHVSYTFFQRPNIGKIIQEATSIKKELVDIIVQYRWYTRHPI